jgi:hypothetical protein
MDPATISAIAEVMQAAGQIGGLFTGGDGGRSKLVSYPVWSAIFDEMSKRKDVFGGREGGLFGDTRSAIQQALGGNMGLSPEAMRMMGQRLNRQLDPQFAMARDELRRSFSPRLAGSGAAAASMQQLLGQQAQARSLGQADIQIQDLLARHEGQMAGLQGMQNLYGFNQNALLNLLGQMAGHTRTTVAG